MPARGLAQDEIPLAERLDMAEAEYRNSNNIKSMRKIAREHGLGFSTLQKRVGSKDSTSCVSRKEFNERRQRLSPEKENALVDWILQMKAWVGHLVVCSLGSWRWNYFVSRETMHL